MSQVNMNLQDKVSIVTGAGLGIGKATVLEFLKRGATVIASDINEKNLNLLKDEAQSLGFDLDVMLCDVNVENDIKQLVDFAVSKYGKLDVAFNNAGLSGSFGSFMSQTNDDWDTVVNTNIRSVFWSMKYEAEVMLKQGHGSIINCASISSIVGVQGMPIYTASKHAVMGLTRAASIEMFKQGVRVNAVNPGWVWTAIQDKLWDSKEQADATVASQPQGRWGQPEEIAKTVAFLASDDASLISGHGLVADGGFTVA